MIAYQINETKTSFNNLYIIIDQYQNTDGIYLVIDQCQSLSHLFRSNRENSRL